MVLVLVIVCLQNHPSFPSGGAKDCEEGFEASKGKGKGCSQELDQDQDNISFYVLLLCSSEIVLVAEKYIVYSSKIFKLFFVWIFGSVDYSLRFWFLVHVEFTFHVLDSLLPEASSWLQLIMCYLIT